jgi:hypothetical protein
VADAVHVGGERFHLIGAELRAAHCGHGAAIFFGLRHAVSDCFLDASIAAAAPQPLMRGERGTERRTLAVIAVAAGAGCAADLAALDARAELDHFRRRSLRHSAIRVSHRAGIWMRALGRISGGVRDFTGRGCGVGARGHMPAAGA